MRSLGKQAAGARLERIAAPRSGRVGLPRTCIPSCRACATRTRRCRRSRVPLRRRAARATAPAARHRSARGVGPAVREWITCDLARALDGALEIEGLRVLTDPVWGGAARRCGLPGRGASSRCRCRWRAATARCGARLARSLRPPRLSDHPSAAPQRRALRDLARCGRAPRGVGHAAAAHHRARLVGVVQAATCGAHHHRGALAAFLGTHTREPQQRRSGPHSIIRSPRHAVFFSGDTGLTTEYEDPRAVRSVRPGDARSGRVSSILGRYAPWAG